MEFSPQVALLQSSAPAQPAGVCPKPRLACGQGDAAGAVSPPGVLVPTCGLLGCLCPLGCVPRMLRGGGGAQLNSGSEAEVLVESAQERAALPCLFPPRPALSREL